MTSSLWVCARAADVEVFLEGKPLPLPFIQLDALAQEFDEDHIEGTDDIRFKRMMRDAADRARRIPDTTCPRRRGHLSY